jgi:hypothetical protein
MRLPAQRDHIDRSEIFQRHLLRPARFYGDAGQTGDERRLLDPHLVLTDAPGPAALARVADAVLRRVRRDARALRVDLRCALAADDVGAGGKNPDQSSHR